MRIVFILLLITFSLIFTSNLKAQSQEWKKIDNPEIFKKIYMDTTLTGMPWPTSNLDFYHLDADWQIKYCANGTGVLIFWANETPRTWEIIGDDKVCISTIQGEKCYFCEENTKYKDIFRCGVVGEEEAPWVFRVMNKKPDICP